MPFDRGSALVVGIADYGEAPRLPLAVLNDAHDVAALLKSEAYCGYPIGKVRSIFDRDATLNALRFELAHLAASADPDGTVVIYFSGHGARVGPDVSALVPFDCQLSDLRSTCLLEAEFSAALSAIRSKRLLVLIDACHAGGAGVLKGNAHSSPEFGIFEKTLERLASGSGRVIIASSRATETSLVFDGARNSVFTGKLLEGLRGKAPTRADGLIRVFDIFNYVAEHVRRTVPGRQHPIFKSSDLEDNFPVALNQGGITKTTEPLTPSVRSHGRKLEEILAGLYPLGPTDQDIWARAGGDVSRLSQRGHGRAQWFAAIRLLQQGGGGQGISVRSLVEVALEEFPRHAELAELLSSE
jgi:hypothetical protein